jgi:hypothetical protein
MCHKRKLVDLRLLLTVSLAAGMSACTTLAVKKEDSGVVIARHAQIRSSTAIVAADLVEVSRGDQVEILDTEQAENGERWLRVRAHDEESTEGWVEARNIMVQKVLDSSKELAQEEKDIPAQATGQLRASTNVRLSPDLSNNTNIMEKLESGARFDIVGWKRVNKPKSTGTIESDTAPKAGSVQQNTSRDHRPLVQGAPAATDIACSWRLDLRQAGRADGAERHYLLQNRSRVCRLGKIGRRSRGQPY